ncbi:hypothetical protein FHG87_004587 [Trinorchestia longiramus]|nr:hypothetical protein FHG87_004587 [Trinorchestia longiramus]
MVWLVEIARNKVVAVTQNEGVATARNKAVAVARNKVVAVARNKVVAVARNKVVAVARNKVVAVARNKVKFETSRMPRLIFSLTLITQLTLSTSSYMPSPSSRLICRLRRRVLYAVFVVASYMPSSSSRLICRLRRRLLDAVSVVASYMPSSRLMCRQIRYLKWYFDLKVEERLRTTTYQMVSDDTEAMKRLTSSNVRLRWLTEFSDKCEPWTRKLWFTQA